jgi:hypothetical protein
MKTLKDNSHPTLEDLALASRGDLPFFQQRQVKRHVRYCPTCEHELENYRSLVDGIKHQSEAEALTTGEMLLDWQRLEREMAGNIKVGIAAAQCIQRSSGDGFHRWRLPALVAALSVIFVAGWLINVPRDDMDRVVTAFRSAIRSQHPNGIVLETNPHGVSVRFQGASLTLLHPTTARATASFTSASSVGERYMDDETGQVTIANVYGQ